MALEALLPSEIARLVYGYLIEEKCLKTAKLFLDESPNLKECRSVLSHGKHFTTRACGHSLIDILEKFCLANSTVQEKINKFDNTDKLKHCGDLLNQIKFLLEQYKGQKFVVKVNVATQSLSTNLNESPVKSRKRHSLPNRDEYKSNYIIQKNNEELRIMEAGINFKHVQNNNVEATHLKNLPGYVSDIEIKHYESKSLKKSVDISKEDASKLNEIIKQNNISHDSQNLNLNLLKHNGSDIIKSIPIALEEENLKKYTNSEVQTSEINGCNQLDKNIMTDTVEERLRNWVDSEVQTSDIESPNPENLPPDECVELLSDLTLELLNRTEIQERIADNINKILIPIKSNILEKSIESSKKVSNKSFIMELNKVIETAVNKTENDPEFLELFNTIISSEEILSTEDEMDKNEDDIEMHHEKIYSLPENGVQKIVSETRVSENIINKDIVEPIQKDQCKPEIFKLQHINRSTTIEKEKYFVDPLENDCNLAEKNKSSPTPAVTQQINVKANSKLSNENLILNNSENNIKVTTNNLESPILQLKSINKSENLFHNNTLTSTPLKTCTAVQNFDVCDWFLTQDLPSLHNIYQKENTSVSSKSNLPCVYTAETVTTPFYFSPIVAKDSSKIADKVPATNSIINTNRDQPLNTPDIAYPPSSRVCISNNTRSTITAVVPSKNKTPILQNNSEVIDELLNLQNLQKSNGNLNSISSLLKDSNEYSRYFSIDSIMLFGTDNNASTIPTPVTVPEIEVEDPITLTGTGLSPFLRMQKKSDKPDSVTEKCDKEIIQTVINKKNGKFDILNEKGNEDIVTNTSVVMINEIITKHTPTTLLENRSKNHRLSLSTPKKPSNYVRALNFDTPSNRSYSESKLKNNDNKICLSSETIKRNLKDSCKSSLFQSPPFTNSEIIEQKLDINPLGNRDKTLINIDEQKIINKEKEETNKRNNNSSKDQLILKQSSNCSQLKTEIVKKSWDSDLRKYLVQNETQEKKPQKRSCQKKSKEEENAFPKKIKKEEKNTLKKFKKNVGKPSPKKIKKREFIKGKEQEQVHAKSSDVEESNELKKRNQLNQLINSVNGKKKNEIKGQINRSIHVEDKKQKEIKKTKENNKDLLINYNGKNVKVFAETKQESETKLSIISKEEEKVKRIENDSNNIKLDNMKIIKNPLEMILSVNMNDDDEDLIKLASQEMIDLNKLSDNNKNNVKHDKNTDEKMHQDEEAMSVAFETIFSEKILNLEEDNRNAKENSYINKNLIDYKKIEEQLSIITNTEVSKTNTQKTEVLYDQVSKIECGKIVQKKYARLQTLEKNITQDKKRLPLNNFALILETPRKNEDSLQIPPTPQVLSPGSSSLITLITKFNDDSRSVPSMIATPLECPPTPDIVITPPKVSEENKTETSQKTNDSYYHPTLITFESLRKSEITQFEVIKENLLKDSRSKYCSNIQNTNSNLLNGVKQNSESDIKASKDNILKLETSMSYRDKQTNSKIENSDLSNSSSSSCTCDSCSSSSSSEYNDYKSDLQNENKEIKNNSETSPVKVFSLNKSDKELTETIKETPAKDENSCIEAEIFDTPSTSKPVEIPTNLNAKISEIMILKEQVGRLQSKVKPKIISTERVLPQVITKPQTQLLKALPLNIQIKALEIKNEMNKSALLQGKIKIEKSEEEVAKAVESIMIDDKHVSNENQELDKSIESIAPSPMCNNEDKSDSHKIELIKAIESISKVNSEFQQHNNSVEKKYPIDESSSEANLELVLEDEDVPTVINKNVEKNTEKVESNNSPHEHNTRFQSRQKAVEENNTLLGNCDTPSDIKVIFDEDNYKRRRRKAFNDDDLIIEYYHESGNFIHFMKPTNYEIIFNMNPPRKKKTQNVQKEKIANKNDTSQDSSASNINNVLGTNAAGVTNVNKGTNKIVNKRKRAAGENDRITIRKRKKNIFIF